ncbi:MAG: amidohydrolase family protein [Planctomycetota bacterium]
MPRFRHASRVLLAGLLLSAAPAAAQSTSDSPLADRPNGPRRSEPARTALVGGTIHAGPDAEPFVGTLVFAGGRIVSITQGEAATLAGTLVHDASGLHLYPAFIEPFYEIDVDAPAPPGSPGAHWSAKVTPRRNALDAEWPGESTRGELRNLGFAVAGLSPDGGIFRGWTGAISLAEPSDDMSKERPTILAERVSQVVAFESSGWGTRAYPTSQVGAVALVRQTLLDAEWQTRQGGGVANALTPIGDRDTPMWFDTPGELEAIRAAKMAREFGRHAVIVGSGQEYQRLDALIQESADARSGLRFVLPLNFPEAPRVTSVAQAESIDLGTLMAWEQAPTNPRRVVEAGLGVALTSSKLSKRSDFHKNLRRAIEHGLAEERALAALTTEPARLLGITRHAGTIEAGKLANVIVATGPIFDAKSQIRDLWIEGRRHEISTPKPPSLEGTWELTLADRFRLDATVDAKGKATISDPAIEGGDTPTASATIERANDTVTFVFDHEPFGMPGIFTLTGTLSGDALIGTGARSDGRVFEFTGVRQPRDADEQQETTRVDSNDADLPPEDLGGYPFGPYAMAEVPASESLLIVNATVWTVADRGILEDAWVLVRDGTIQSVGTGGYPKIAVDRTIDAGGRHVTPGLVDAHSHTGTWTGGTNEAGQAVTAEVRMADTTDPNPVNWYRQLAGGVTTVNTLHGSANPIGGQNVIQKVRWGAVHPDDMHLEGAMPGIKFALGENVKQSNWGDRFTTRYPQTRMGVETLIRDRFHAAQEYAANGNKTANGRTDTELEALAEILAGERLIHCHSYRQDEILMLCRVAEDFGFKIGTFQHGLECYKVAEAVKEHAIGASIFSDWWAFKVEVQDAIPYAGPILHEAGVNVSFNSDSDELARRMNVEAAKAVKYGGLSPEEAIKFVTINPAIQLGIGDRVGSLEPGKDADIAIWSGDPLSTMSRCERVFIDGREYYSLERDAAHRSRIARERERLIQKLMREQAKLGPPRDDEPEADDEDDRIRRGVYAWFHGTEDRTGAGASMCGACGMLPAEYLEMIQLEGR